MGPGDGVDPGGWLVEEEDDRLVQERRGEGETLIDPQGQVAGEGVQVGRKAQLFGVAADPLAGPGLGDAVDRGEVAEVLQDRHILIEGEVLADVADAGLELPAVGGAADRPAQEGQLPLVDGVEPQEHLDEGGLARAVGPQQAQDLPAGQTHIDVVVGDEIPETFGQPPGLHHHRGDRLGALSGAYFDGGRDLAPSDRFDEEEGFEAGLLFGSGKGLEAVGGIEGADASAFGTVGGFVAVVADASGQLFGAPLGDDAPPVEEQEAVHPGGFLHIGGADEGGGPLFAADLLQNLPELQAAEGVDSGGGFVQQQEFGTVQEGADQGELLHHSPAEVPSGPVGEARQARHLQQFLPIGAKGGILLQVADLGEKVQMLRDGEVAVEYQADPLGHQADGGFESFGLARRAEGAIPEADHPLETDHSGDGVHQRAFARSVGPDEAQDLSFTRAQGRVTDADGLFVADGDVLDVEERSAHRLEDRDFVQAFGKPFAVEGDDADGGQAQLEQRVGMQGFKMHGEDPLDPVAADIDLFGGELCFLGDADHFGGDGPIRPGVQEDFGSVVEFDPAVFECVDIDLQVEALGSDEGGYGHSRADHLPDIGDLFDGMAVEGGVQGHFGEHRFDLLLFCRERRDSFAEGGDPLPQGVEFLLGGLRVDESALGDAQLLVGLGLFGLQRGELLAVDFVFEAGLFVALFLDEVLPKKVFDALKIPSVLLDQVFLGVDLALELRHLGFANRHQALGAAQKLGGIDPGDAQFGLFGGELFSLGVDPGLDRLQLRLEFRAGEAGDELAFFHGGAVVDFEFDEAAGVFGVEAHQVSVDVAGSFDEVGRQLLGVEFEIDHPRRHRYQE